MDILIRGLAIFFGLFFGLLVWSRTVRAVQSIWVVAKERRSGTQSTASLGIGLVLTLLSTLGLLAAAGVFTFYVLSGPHRPEWNWFFGGALGVPLVIAINVLLFLHRKKKRESSGNQP